MKLIHMLLIGIVGLPVNLFASKTTIQKAITYYENLDFKEAKETFLKALLEEKNQPEDLKTIYLYLGILYGIENNKEKAELYFKLLLAVDPEAQLPPAQPPKIKIPFQKAKEFWNDQKIELEHTPPEKLNAQLPGVLVFKIKNDKLEMIHGIRVIIKKRGEEIEEKLSVEGKEEFKIPIPATLLNEAGILEYYVELIGEYNSIVKRFGKEQPFVLEILPPIKPKKEIIIVEKPIPSTPWYKKWWLWSLIGGSVIGITLSIVLPLTLPSNEVIFESTEVRIVTSNQN